LSFTALHRIELWTSARGRRDDETANEKFNGKDVNRFLKQQGVTLITASLDEVPIAYKNICAVMAAEGF